MLRANLSTLSYPQATIFVVTNGELSPRARLRSAFELVLKEKTAREGDSTSLVTYCVR